METESTDKRVGWFGKVVSVILTLVAAYFVIIWVEGDLISKPLSSWTLSDFGTLVIVFVIGWIALGVVKGFLNED